MTKRGFVNEDKLRIKAPSLDRAFEELGRGMREVSQKILEQRMKMARDRGMVLESAQADLMVIEEIARDRWLEIEGVNYAARYLEALNGYGRGVGMAVDEVAFLQKEIEAGCMTMVARSPAGAIAFLHAEENGDDAGLPKGIYDYRLVELKLPDRELVFFAYPGLCSWGSAFGIDKTTNYAQFTDDLYIKEEEMGRVWVNLAAFALFDAANMDKGKLIIEKLVGIARRWGWHNGYAIHMVKGGKQSQAVSYELAANLVMRQPELAGHVVQVNRPITDEIKVFDELEKGILYWEMVGREKRLERIWRLGWWKLSSAKEAIKTGLKAMAYPHGDLRYYKNSDGRKTYYHTGLPGPWIAAHFLGWVGEKSEFYIGKRIPPPVKGMEYSNDIDENYRYGEEKLWRLKNKG